MQQSICRNISGIGRYPALLVALIVFSVINTAIWLWIDTRPPRWDEAAYLRTSLKYHEALTEEGAGGFIRALVEVDRKRPPLVSALAVPVYFLFGKSFDIALLVNLLAFVVLLLAVYRLGTRLASAEAGVLAAFLVATYPSVFSLSRIFLFDFWDTTLVAVSLYLFVSVEGFSQKRASIILGAILGFGLLCRPFFLVFVIGPLAVSLYTIWKTRAVQTETQETNRLVIGRYLKPAAVSCAVVAGPWYVINALPLLKRSLSAAYGAEAVGYGPPNPLTFQALTSYLITFINWHTTLAGTVLFVLAGAILWRNRSAFAGQKIHTVPSAMHNLCLLFSSVLLAYVFFSTLPSQDQKNITPILPGVAIISAWGLSLLHPVMLKKVVIGVSVVWFAAQFWLMTYGWAALPPVVAVPLGKTLPRLTLIQQGASDLVTFPLSPKQEHWPLYEILLRLTGGEVGPNGVRTLAKPAVVAIIPDHPFFNMNNFDYFATLHGLPVVIEHPGDPRWPAGKEFRTLLLGVDAAVIKTGNPGSAWLTVFNKEILAFLRSPESGFKEIGPRFPLPDGSEAVLYLANDNFVLNEAPPIQFRTPVQFTDEVELLGYDLEEKGIVDGRRAFLVTYYWQALKEVTNDYQVLVHLTEGTTPKVVARWEHAPARGRYPASWWRPGTIVKDQGLYFLRNSLTANEYVMWVGLRRSDSAALLPATSASTIVRLDEEKTRAAVGAIRGYRENAS